MGQPKIMIITADPKTLMCHRAELLEHWASKGCEIVALAHGAHAAATAYLRSLGGKLLDIPLQRNQLNPWADYQCLQAIKQIMAEEQPDAVFAYTLKCVGLAGMAAKSLGIPEFYPLICGLGYSFGENAGIKQRLARWASSRVLKRGLRDAMHVFFQNQEDQAQLRAAGIVPDYIASSVLPGSGVDLQKFRYQALREDTLTRGQIRFVFVSRLLRSKGAAAFAQAAQSLRRLHPQWEFHMVGGLDSGPDGVTKEELQQWQSKGAVIWQGETSNVVPHLESAHVVVLPSTYREGVPRSLLEALAVGRPLITTDAIGCRNTVVLTELGQAQRTAQHAVREGKNGLLISPGSSEALESAMARLGENAGLLRDMSQQSRAHAEAHFSVETVVKQTCEGMHLLRELRKRQHA